mgnify:CR=1 FL=1
MRQQVTAPVDQVERRSGGLPGIFGPYREGRRKFAQWFEYLHHEADRDVRKQGGQWVDVSLYESVFRLLEPGEVAEAIEVYRERMADASDFTFYFVGSFDQEAIKPLIERYLGSLPSTKRKETWKDVGSILRTCEAHTFMLA